MIDTYLMKNKPVVIAQISDSHLFCKKEGLHHGHNVYINLKKVLYEISQNPTIDYIVFTGDLSQDHSEQSYLNFVAAVKESKIEAPFYRLAGNHDEPKLLDKYLSQAPFISATTINHGSWQIQLLNSKGDTPAGYVGQQEFTKLKVSVKTDKHQLIMMHHHPIDVNYFIDNHGLLNKTEFWQHISSYSNIKAIACGHVHGAFELTKQLVDSQGLITLFTCPATSIQFDPCADGVSPLAKGPAYRLYLLYENGAINSKVISVD